MATAVFLLLSVKHWILNLIQLLGRSGKLIYCALISTLSLISIKSRCFLIFCKALGTSKKSWTTPTWEKKKFSQNAIFKKKKTDPFFNLLKKVEGEGFWLLDVCVKKKYRNCPMGIKSYFLFTLNIMAMNSS